jgi:hypothetical protein
MFTISKTNKSVAMRGKTVYACPTNTCRFFKTFTSVVTPVAAPNTAAAPAAPAAALAAPVVAPVAALAAPVAAPVTASAAALATPSSIKCPIDVLGDYLSYH